LYAHEGRSEEAVPSPGDVRHPTNVVVVVPFPIAAAAACFIVVLDASDRRSTRVAIVGRRRDPPPASNVGVPVFFSTDDRARLVAIAFSTAVSA
jgi:hypothetical protein